MESSACGRSWACFKSVQGREDDTARRHGSKRGSTREVAEALARKLAEGGREVELRRAADVEDLTHYEAVVLGGSLYFGRWHEDAARFLAKHRRELSELQLAVFAIGPKTAEAQDLAESRAQLDKALRKAPEVVPTSVAVFGGVIDPTKLRFPLSRMPASDGRNWDTVGAWADELGTTI